MTVRARFYVIQILHHHIARPGAVCAEVKLAPVYGDDNKPWSEATPQGQIAMTITNPAAIDEFELGASYELTFNKVSLDPEDLAALASTARAAYDKG